MVETTRTLDDIDSLLRRNWFIDKMDVIDLLYLASEKDWQWIIENRSRYSPVIQDIICHEANLPKIVCKISVRDMTDTEYEEFILNAETENEIKVENNWQEYKKKHGLVPPRTFQDMQLESLKLEYDNKYKQYNRRYSVNRDHIAIEIGTIKEKIQQLEDEIAQNVRDWEFLEKTAFRFQAIVPKLSNTYKHCSNV